MVESALGGMVRAVLVASVLVALCPGAAQAQKKPAKEPAAAEVPPPVERFRCAAEVYYSWKRLPPPPPPPEPTKGTTSTTIPWPEEYSKPIEVLSERIRREGKSEAEAKGLIQDHLSTAQREALNVCEKKHAERANCIAEGLKSAGEEYKHFDYPTRQTFLKALSRDCENSSGICLGTRASEITCEKVQEDAPPAAGDEAASKEAPKKK